MNERPKNKRIVLCLDGTWNQVRDPRRVTNVVKLAQAVLPVATDGTPQVVYYNSGVGTGDAVDKFLGGVFGRGLRSNVKRAYAFLSLNYEPGDEIYIFGFSRGAYTARSVAGVVTVSGILRKQDFEQFELVWNYYQEPPKRRAAGGSRKADEYLKQRDKTHVEARVRCVGVWDTVGSYGVPAGLGLGALARYFTSWMHGFNDTDISDKVQIGLHAMALDECRRPFTPTFWTDPPPGKGPAGHVEQVEQVVEQVWFPGVHSDIGGGYPETGLSDLAFQWMTTRVTTIGHFMFGSSLEFDASILKEGKPSYQAMQHRSERGWPISRLLPYRRPVLAGPLPKTGQEPVNERVHWSVMSRRGQEVPVEGGGKGPYEPVNLPAAVPQDRIVFADNEPVRVRQIAVANQPVR